MIVIHHIVIHCVSVQLTDSDSIEILNNGWFSDPIFYKRLFLLNVTNTFGPISNAIFILISGYFMLQKGKKVNVVKVAKKLLLQLGFASIVLVVASSITYYFAGENMYFNLMNITAFNNGSWYVGYYFSVILIGKIFLSERLLRMDKRTFTIYLVVMFALTQFSFTASLMNAVGSGFGTVATGIFLFSLGGYIRIYEPFKQIRSHAFLVIVALTYALIYLSFYNRSQTNIEDYYRSLLTESETEIEEFTQTITGFGNNSIIVIVIAVVMFEIFKRIRMPKVKLVNFLGQSTFMIYLLHDNEFFYSIWGLHDWITDIRISSLEFLIKLFVCGVATFTAGVAVYFLYLTTLKLFRICKPIFMRSKEI